ncbi:hypothetical protein [Staphylococcus felis]|uniref:hypothetical protein n=1 Tax=Staphylococcus felis TaxID=46127 RepID=UPI00237B231B|nr:hypothetical protein [Staphylococcus felis]
MTKVEYGRVFNHFELLLAGILEVKLTEKQEELFRELMRLSMDDVKVYGRVVSKEC